MATVFNISALADYTNAHSDELLVKASLGSKTLEYVAIAANVKYKDEVDALDSAVVLADGSECSWDPAGSDTLSPIILEDHPVKINKSWCGKALRKKAAGHQLMWEAGRISLPYEEQFAESNLNAIQEAVETMVWQGDSATSVTGFIADAASASASTTELGSGSTATAVIDAAVAAVDARMLKLGVNIFVSDTLFRNYIQEQNGTCCANKPIQDAAVADYKYLGDSRITIIPVQGLEGASVAAVAASKRALIYVTDIENSENVYKMWNDDKTDETNFKVEFLAGTAIAFSDEVKVITVAAAGE